jgi:hypothetical protein
MKTAQEPPVNRFAKTILVGTSLTPILWACALAEWRAVNGCDGLAVGLFLASLPCLLACWWLVRRMRRTGEPEPLKTKKVKQADKEILAFLLAYLLPFLSRGGGALAGDLYVMGFVVVILAASVYSSNGFTFNPLLNVCFGYHFYEVESQSGVTHLLLTRAPILTAEGELQVVRLQNYLYLDVGDR